MTRTQTKLVPAHSLTDLTLLNRDLSLLKKRGSAQVPEIQDLAERIWRTNLAYDRRLMQLENEKKQVIQ